MPLKTDVLKRLLEKSIDVAGDVAGTWAKKKIAESPAPSAQPAPGAQSVAPAHSTVRLLLMNGETVQNQISLSAGAVILGRQNLNPGDPTISRTHAQIFLKDNAYWIADAGSDNGTYVNGSLITAPHALHHSDRIQIGQSKLSFSVS